MISRKFVFQILVLPLATLSLLASTANAAAAAPEPPTGLSANPNEFCSIIAQPRPAFLVVDTKNALNRGSSYFPKGTIVRVNSEDLARVPMTGTTIPASFFPRVKVLSVPDAKSQLNLSWNRQTATFSRNDGGVGQRVSVGQDAYVNATDLSSVVSGANLTSPTNTIFMVREDAAAHVLPEFQNKPIRLSTEGANFLTQRCCPAGMDHADGITAQASHHPFEYDRDPRCGYTPTFDILKAVDRGSGPLNYNVERSQVAMADCDRFLSALSPVEQQNQRAAFMVSRALSPPSNDDLERLQRACWHQATRTRQSASRYSHAPIGGNQTKGMCKAAGNDCLMEANFIKSRIPGDDAIMANTYLPAVGFTNILSLVRTAAEAPPGAILVYKNTSASIRGVARSGHFEIKVDEKTYCSDFCKGAPIDSYLRGRMLVGVFVKKRPDER